MRRLLRVMAVYKFGPKGSRGGWGGRKKFLWGGSADTERGLYLCETAVPRLAYVIRWEGWIIAFLCLSGARRKKCSYGRFARISLFSFVIGFHVIYRCSKIIRCHLEEFWTENIPHLPKGRKINTKMPFIFSEFGI